MAYKVFTNGSVLNASEINENLMRQSVIAFSNAAARTAAIPAPSDGMLTWLEDIKAYQSWSGSSWVSPFGSTLLVSSNFTTQTSVALDNILSSTYRFYDIYITASGSAAASLQTRLRSGSTDHATNTYLTQTSTVQNTTYAAAASVSVPQWTVGTLRTAGLGFWSATLANPMVASETQFNSRGFDRTQRIEDHSGYESTVGFWNGLRFFPSTGNMTGQINVFGRRN